MSFRRRHRWFRRMALGLAFATAVFAGRASVAAAKLEEGTGSRTGSTVSAASVGGPAVITVQSTGSPRPDDRPDRFAHLDAVPQPELAGEEWSFGWGSAVPLGLGALVLALGLGLALGYVRRPRLAGS